MCRYKRREKETIGYVRKSGRGIKDEEKTIFGMGADCGDDGRGRTGDGIGGGCRDNDNERGQYR